MLRYMVFLVYAVKPQIVVLKNRVRAPKTPKYLTGKITVVVCLLWEQVAAGSNPATSTKGTVVYKVLHACLKHKRYLFDSGLFHKQLGCMGARTRDAGSPLKRSVEIQNDTINLK